MCRDKLSLLPLTPKNLGSTACYSILNTVGKRSIFCSTAKTNSEVYTLSRHEYGGEGVGKNSGDYVHINIHKYSHDACASTHDVDMNAHTHMHVHTIIIHTYIMNRILNRKKSQICLQWRVCRCGQSPLVGPVMKGQLEKFMFWNQNACSI